MTKLALEDYKSSSKAYLFGKLNEKFTEITNIMFERTSKLISSAEKVRNYIEDFNQKNNNVQLSVVSDLSTTLTQRTQLLTENAILGMILVLIFLSVFLNTRLAFWVAFGLPVAFLGMFIFAGFILF